jgi:hypothetical protein
MYCVVDWVSNLPVSVAVLLALAGGGAVSAIGLLGLNRILPHPIRSTHNDVSGFILAIVGVIYEERAETEDLGVIGAGGVEGVRRL